MTERMDEAFDALDWHDSVLLSLSIDRRVPGERDEVVLVVEWPDGRSQMVRFTDCYALDVQMNFGVLAPESIRTARCIADAPKLAEMRQRWTALGVDLGHLRCFEITTSSTASEIRIYAKRFEASEPSPSAPQTFPEGDQGRLGRTGSCSSARCVYHVGVIVDPLQFRQTTD